MRVREFQIHSSVNSLDIFAPKSKGVFMAEALMVDEVQVVRGLSPCVMFLSQPLADLVKIVRTHEVDPSYSEARAYTTFVLLRSSCICGMVRVRFKGANSSSEQWVSFGTGRAFNRSSAAHFSSSVAYNIRE